MAKAIAIAIAVAIAIAIAIAITIVIARTIARDRALARIGTIAIVNPFKPNVFRRVKSPGGGAKRHPLEINKGAP